jgi:hypothetical protein
VALGPRPSASGSAPMSLAHRNHVDRPGHLRQTGQKDPNLARVTLA